MDISRMLTEKSRKQWFRNNAPLKLTNSTSPRNMNSTIASHIDQTTPSPISQQSSQGNDHRHSDSRAITGDSAPLQAFCRDLLVEMRKDRDIIQETIITINMINRQIGSMPVLERDIRDMRADISRIADRMAAVETHYATPYHTEAVHQRYFER